MHFCKVADIQDWQNPDFEPTANLLRCIDRNRKAWEFIHVYNGLRELGCLYDGARAIGLGVGNEPLIYALANVCGEVIATDLYDSDVWSTASMSTREVYQRNPFPYRQERLVVQHMDMTKIEYPDNSFDFVWSCCAIEHVRNFKDLFSVYSEIHRVLKPGGIAALTTEFNMTNLPFYEPHLLFTDRDWMDKWITGQDPLIKGFDLLDEIDFSVSNVSENEPVPRRDVNRKAQIQIIVDDIVINSVAFFLRKSSDFSASYHENWLPHFWRTYLEANTRFSENEFQSSEVLLKQLTTDKDLEPRLKIRAYHRLANSLFAQRKVDEIKELCKAAIPICEQIDAEHQILPIANYSKISGFLDEAKRLYERTEALPGSDLTCLVWSLIGIAECYEWQGDFRTALSYVEKAANQLPPGFTNEIHLIYFHRGYCNEILGNVELAINSYNLALSHAIPNTGFYNNCQTRLQLAQQKLIEEQNSHFQKLIEEQNSHFQKLDEELQRVKAELEAELKETRVKLRTARTKRKQVQEALNATKIQLQQAEEKISFMENSKFWKLRSNLVALKKHLTGQPQ